MAEVEAASVSAVVVAEVVVVAVVVVAAVEVVAAVGPAAINTLDRRTAKHRLLNRSLLPRLRFGVYRLLLGVLSRPLLRLQRLHRPPQQLVRLGSLSFPYNPSEKSQAH
ncbi:MAG TPA: hypothetical protein VHJ56_04275 [Candidatus Binatia bacterium]|nr:hypothetical protein [Candidatus Binatia bacterium]